VYDPSTGRDWAHRFSLDGNPQPEADWPRHTLTYQDAACQSMADEVPFTLIDFVAGDPRYAEHFASVPVEDWTDAMVPVDDIVRIEGRTRIERVPSLMLVDADDVLHRVIVDEKLVREARRCLSMWHSLQELGGIHNSYAERALTDAPPIVVVQEAPLEQPVQQPTIAESTVAESVDDSGDAEPERSPDEAYIETARCSTCNECTLINSTMFAYNDNQQAFIADLKAGTYAQLVEAAESCQVSVIHPGKPWNLSEPGLEDLLKRAEQFA